MHKSTLLILLYLCFSCNSKNVEVSSEPVNDAKDSVSQSSVNIEGVYVTVNNPEEVEKCDITITIEKAGNGYIYKYKSDTRSLAGKVSINGNDIDGHSIILEGIEWAFYEGELVLHEDGDYYPKEDVENRVGIEGDINDKKIIIQNYGNSMDSFQQIEECGKKFIYLEKQSPSSEASASNSESISQEECFEKSAFKLPYNQKTLADPSSYKIVKCDLEGAGNFLCDTPMLRYIPLPDYKKVKVVLVPMDCGDFEYRFYLLTFVNKKVVASQYVEGNFSEPGDITYEELTRFTIDKDYKINITTDSFENGKSTSKETTNFQVMSDGTLKKV